jgi:hypothetical protein
MIAAIVVLLVLLFRDQRKTADERAQLAGEMDAAREVQRRLVPAELPAVAGYALEAAYLPANEVGGDFYQVLTQVDDSTLIVVGDVSGKGLKAAMTGALAIGAIRALAAEGLGPAELLRRLNLEIVEAGNEGFITCICAPGGERGYHRERGASFALSQWAGSGGGFGISAGDCCRGCVWGDGGDSGCGGPDDVSFGWGAGGAGGEW